MLFDLMHSSKGLLHIKIVAQRGENITMIALLLVTVLYLAAPTTSLEIVVDNKGSGCLVNREFAEAIDKFHNGLRQRVARGDGGRAGKEMYGLVRKLHKR
ncbi:hypothetical protein Y032_0222g2617 [Ancylostoma ceylanicum]|uniref:Uncharacterized protein n=2 Tax=Ancylostoma ceylanicum TaxID=53326 RepID=A0A016SIS6_9BILA|nr:hypothetical protein Y032_0222g2617 [Ancylostoma ceylanicum]